MLQTSVIGHLGSDAEVKNSNGKDFVTFRVADTNKWTDDKGQVHEETTWVDCIMNGKPAVAEFLKKGTMIYAAGSTGLRVYSSAKDRCMKAGLTINVRQVELLGGKVDEVPKVLYTKEDAKEVRINKFFHAPDLQRDETQPETIELISRSNETFLVDRNGWVQKVKEEEKCEN